MAIGNSERCEQVGSPLISVIVPAFNYAHLLPRALNSVLPQLNDESELLVVDDGSTDDTLQVVQDVLRQHPRAFRYIKKENGGAASARNHGIRESRGKYLVFLDADDELVEGALKALSAHLAEHTQTQVVLAAHWSVDADGRRRLHRLPPIPKDPLKRLKAYLLEKRIAISHGACAMHRDVFSRGDYPESFRNGEDIPVFAQAVANHACSVLSQPMAIIHKHDDSLRHRLDYSKAGGSRLVDEVFSDRRLPKEFHILQNDYRAQRFLSLFRAAYFSGDMAAAKVFFREAVKHNAWVVLKWSYTRKLIKIWVGYSFLASKEIFLKLAKKLKKIWFRDYFRPKIKVRNRLGLLLLLRYQNYIDRKLILSEPYEARQLSALSRAIIESRASLFVDIGANIGLYSVYLASRAPRLEKVYAIEPQPENYNQLCANIFMNHLSNRIVPIRKGASNKPARLVFYENKGRSTGTSRLAETAPKETKQDEFSETLIEVIAMDSILADENDKVAVIKIDVEGHESQVLEGMKRFLASNTCLMQMEVLGESSERENKLAEICDCYGLSVLARIESDCFLTNDINVFPFWE